MTVRSLQWTNANLAISTITRLVDRQRLRKRAASSAFIICLLLGSTGRDRLACALGEPSHPPIFHKVASVLALTPEEIRHHQFAHFQGVVIRCTDWGIVVRDRTGGIWVNYMHAAKRFSVGDNLEIFGVTDSGLYSPVINPSVIRQLGRAPLPKPTKVTFRQLSTGNYDAQYVSLTGIVRSAGIRPNVESTQNFVMKIEMADGIIYAAFPERCAAIGSTLIDAVVRLNGAGSSSKNENMQLTYPTLVMSGMEAVKVLRPPPRNLFALPLIPIGRLMQFRSGTDYYHRVRVAGTVTYYKPGESLILEDECRALYVETAQVNDIKVGDHVEVIGLPAPSATGPILQDAVIRDIEPGQPLLPTSVTPSDLSSGKYNYNFVATEGRLLRREQEPFLELLLLQNRSSLFLVELVESGGSKLLQNLQEGSVVRVSGISLLDITGTWNTGGPSASSIRYRVMLRSPNDVQVIQPPSWWSKTHIVYIAGVLVVLVLTFLAMVVYGRMEELRLQSVLEERERLANEVHDTLAQSFAGIGFQLQAIRKAIPMEQSHLSEQIDLARALVRHSHKEARISIEPMSTETLEHIDLFSALKSSARSMLEGGSVEVRAVESGKPRPLPPDIAVTLLRIGQEAIANAARHADPSHLDVSVVYQNDCVRLTIADDGCGFVKSGGLLGFGLRGMRKRAAALSAELKIVSNPGEGTHIEVTAPVPEDLTLITLIQNIWRNFSGSILHVSARAK